MLRMLPLIGAWLQQFWGPFRLLESHLFLIALGALLSATAAWAVFPRTWRRLPRDRGRAHTPAARFSVGKPTGGGLILFLLLVPLVLLLAPWNPAMLGLLACLACGMSLGFLDDRSSLPWGQLRKGLTDLAVAVAAAWLLSRGRTMTIWLPLYKHPLQLTPWLYIPMAAALLWTTLNATNCCDGVDGLAGTLTLLSLFYLGALLYGVVGHRQIAEYLLIPHNPEGARWAVMVFTMAGGLAGYLWHNAEPSRVLMGDAGSRFLGLLVGLAVLVTGNPFLIVVVAPVVLVNGGTGLLKILLLRVLRRIGFDVQPPGDPNGNRRRQHVVVRALHRVRFPLHDHCRKNLGWTNAQVLMRFVLIQLFLTPLLFVLLLKIR